MCKNKNINLKNKNNKIINKKVKNSQGSALAETVLITAISIVVIVAIFYPQMMYIFETSIESLSNWFTSAIDTIGVIN